MIDNCKIVEQCRNHGYFHLAHPDMYPLMSLCGKQTIVSPLGVEWGKVVPGLAENFCKKCEEIQKGE